MFLIYRVDNHVESGAWQVKDVGEQTVPLVREVTQDICKEVRIGCHLGWCQCPLPYGDVKLRLEAWQKLVAKAIINLQEQPLETAK
jgi:hypothetical protein